jgi:hypothetical protein
LALAAASIGGGAAFTTALYLTGYFTSVERLLLNNIIAGKFGYSSKNS